MKETRIEYVPVTSNSDPKFDRAAVGGWLGLMLILGVFALGETFLKETPEVLRAPLKDIPHTLLVIGFDLVFFGAIIAFVVFAFVSIIRTAVFVLRLIRDICDSFTPSLKSLIRGVVAVFLFVSRILGRR